MSKKVVIALSGGMDSATLAAFYLDKGYEVYPISFNYGSKHNPYEFEMAVKFTKYYNMPEIKRVDLPFINQLFKSNLLNGQGDIPEGHYEDSNMSLTVVPGRNIIFASIMAGYAWSVGAEIVALGVHGGDHHIYADCRAGFIAAMNSAIIQGTEDKVRLEAPFQYLNKYEILKIGYSLKNIEAIPYEYTRTCYKDQELSCGKCGSCTERLEAFNLLGIKDPIKYEK